MIFAAVLAVLSFTAPGGQSAVAELTLDGSAGTIATLSLPGLPEHHLTLLGKPFPYRILLGELAQGDYKLSVNDARVAGSRFSFHSDPIYTHAPILYARQNTIGKFTDVPLMMYAEKLEGNILQYTVIFSNEDGGTSTRALMARWGRTTDIEYIYRVSLDDGTAIVQGRNHQDLPFTGPFEGRQPLLIPVTDNNMVSGETKSVIRYQFAPSLVDLRRQSREAVMDAEPLMYRVMAEELEREGKLRPFGVVDGQKISDPRNYLYIEAKVTNTNSRVYALARAGNWRKGNLGRIDYGIERSGYIRTAIELPPGAALTEIGFGCDVVDVKQIAGTCVIERVSKVFLLGREYNPMPTMFRLDKSIPLATGEVWTMPLPSR